MIGISVLNFLTFSHACKNDSIGVPQGSILGPLLYIPNINDLPNVCSYMQASIMLYADDTAMFFE